MNTPQLLVNIAVICHLWYSFVDGGDDQGLLDECSRYCAYTSTSTSTDIPESTHEFTTEQGMATPEATKGQQMTPIHQVSSNSVASSTPRGLSTFQEIDATTSSVSTDRTSTQQMSRTSLSDPATMSEHTDLITSSLTPSVTASVAVTTRSQSYLSSKVTDQEQQTPDHFQVSSTHLPSNGTDKSQAFSTIIHSTSTSASISGPNSLVTEATAQVPVTIENQTTNISNSPESVLPFGSSSQSSNVVTTGETAAVITDHVSTSTTPKQVTSGTQTTTNTDISNVSETAESKPSMTLSTNTPSSTEGTSISPNTNNSRPPITLSTNTTSLVEITSLSSNSTISEPSNTPATSSIISAEALSSSRDISTPLITASTSKTSSVEGTSLSPNTVSSGSPLTSSTSPTSSVEDTSLSPNTVSSGSLLTSSTSSTSLVQDTSLSPNTVSSGSPLTSSTISATSSVEGTSLSPNTVSSGSPITQSTSTTSSVEVTSLSPNTVGSGSPITQSISTTSSVEATSFPSSTSTKSPIMQSTSTTSLTDAKSSSDSASLRETITGSFVTEVASEASSTVSESEVHNEETSSATGSQVSHETSDKSLTLNSESPTVLSFKLDNAGITSETSSAENLGNSVSTDIQSLKSSLGTTSVSPSTTVTVMSLEDNTSLEEGTSSESSEISTVRYNSTIPFRANLNQTLHTSNSSMTEDEPDFFLNEDGMEDSFETLSTTTKDSTLVTLNLSFLASCKQICIEKGGVFILNTTKNVSSSKEAVSSSITPSITSPSAVTSTPPAPVTRSLSTVILTQATAPPSGRYENKSPAWGSAIFRLNFSISFEIEWKTSYGEVTTNAYVVLVDKIRRYLLSHFLSCPGFQGIQVYRLRSGSVVCDYGIDIAASFIRNKNDTLNFLKKVKEDLQKTNTTATVGNLTTGFLEKNWNEHMIKASATMQLPCKALGICPVGHICKESTDGNVTCLHRCTNNNPCQNGGICSVNEVGNTQCRCVNDDSNVYYGSLCEKKDEKLSLEYRYIIAITIGGAATLVIFTVAMYFICKRRRRYHKDEYGTSYLTDMDDYHQLGPNIETMPLRMQSGVDNMGYGGPESGVQLSDGREYTVYRDPQTNSKSLVYQPSSSRVNPYSDTSLERSSKFHTEFYSSGRMNTAVSFEDTSRESEDKPSSGLRSNVWKGRSRHNDHDVAL